MQFPILGLPAGNHSCFGIEQRRIKGRANPVGQFGKVLPFFILAGQCLQVRQVLEGPETQRIAIGRLALFTQDIIPTAAPGGFDRLQQSIAIGGFFHQGSQPFEIRQPAAQLLQVAGFADDRPGRVNERGFGIHRGVIPAVRVQHVVGSPVMCPGAGEIGVQRPSQQITGIDAAGQDGQPLRHFGILEHAKPAVDAGDGIAEQVGVRAKLHSVEGIAA